MRAGFQTFFSQFLHQKLALKWVKKESSLLIFKIHLKISPVVSEEKTSIASSKSCILVRLFSPLQHVPLLRVSQHLVSEVSIIMSLFTRNFFHILFNFRAYRLPSSFQIFKFFPPLSCPRTCCQLRSHNTYLVTFE